MRCRRMASCSSALPGGVRGGGGGRSGERERVTGAHLLLLCPWLDLPALAAAAMTACTMSSRLTLSACCRASRPCSSSARAGSSCSYSAGRKGVRMRRREGRPVRGAQRRRRHPTVCAAHLWRAEQPPGQRPVLGQLKLDGVEGCQLRQLRQNLAGRRGGGLKGGCITANDLHPPALAMAPPLGPPPPPSSPFPPGDGPTCEGERATYCTSVAMGTLCTPPYWRSLHACSAAASGTCRASRAGST